MMSKRPFNKIRKIEKKENLEIPEEESENPRAEAGSKEKSKPAITMPTGRRKIIINPGTLTNNEDNAKEPEQKTSLGSKPNLFKGRINKPPAPNREGNQQENVSNYSEAPKPTPMVLRKKGNFRPREPEGIIVQQEDEQSMGYGAEESKELKVEESSNFLGKPDFRPKKFSARRMVPQAQGEVEESKDFTQSRDNPSFYPQLGSVPVNIEYREINISPATGISQGKLDKQRKRTKQLSHLLNLEIDLYEQMLSIGNITPYEIYINKIKGGFLKNSLDQAFDEKTTNYCQTLPLEFADFTNQCPQDYSIDINKIEKLDDDHLFDNFILKMAPIIEELIQPTNTITEPPIFLLAFRPAFKAFFKCPYPIFIYRSEEFNLDLIVVGQKLYIAEGQIESVLMIGKSMVAGLKNGYLILWNGQNNKSSRLYRQIQEYTNTTNFQLPSYCGHHLDKYSPYASQFSIVSLLHEGGQDFISLDSTGKVVRWKIQNQQNGSQVLRGESVIEVRILLQRPALKAYKIKRRGDSLYVSTSMGIVIVHNNQIRQLLEAEGDLVVQYQVPKRSPLVYAVTANQLLIYNQMYSHALLTISFNIGTETLTQIIIPELQHDNREIIILSVFYITDSAGQIYEVRLLENQFEYFQKLGEEHSDPRKDKNVIFRGVNRAGESLETLKLMRDLKITKQCVRMGVNSEKTVGNLKGIIEKNREVMTMLQQQSAMMV